MNKSQKILTFVFLGLFTLTLIVFPHTYCWCPIFLHYGGYPNWRVVRVEWLWLAVIYTGVFFVLQSPKNQKDR